MRLTLALFCWLLSGVTLAVESITLSELSERTHFHGIAVDARDASRVYLATHHGVYVVDGEGRAARISRDTSDYMGFTPHPSDPGVLLASGHPAGGGNLGFIVSRDGGKTWQQLSPGVGGPVDFHQMDVSRADPNVVYGAFKGLQVSKDGGKTWRLSAPLPEGLIDLAASAVDPDRLYAATKGGLLYSTDAGASWRPAYLRRSPATLVQTGPAGELYAFVLGAGLIKTTEPELGWKPVGNGFGERYLLHLAVDPADGRRLYAVTSAKEVITSDDGGSSWRALGR